MHNRLRILAAALAISGALALPASAAPAAADNVPKVVFQINDAANASAILRFVTNYLVAEPRARVTVVGYASGIDFMLADAKDARGDPWAIKVEALAAQGVDFKVCNNTLKSRNLDTAVVAKEATVVPSAVNEIIRLQTREGYAYFQHVK
ncbi:MAG: DsrE family protein [Rubrivivax sp.]|nr:DsrE family protein [Rubrivivax sp.]